MGADDSRLRQSGGFNDGVKLLAAAEKRGGRRAWYRGVVTPAIDPELCLAGGRFEPATAENQRFVINGTNCCRRYSKPILVWHSSAVEMLTMLLILQAETLYIQMVVVMS